jgi:hypothetical protein
MGIVTGLLPGEQAYPRPDFSRASQADRSWCHPKVALIVFGDWLRWAYRGGSMPGATSPWRVNDVVAYDLMRAAAGRAMALLSAVAQSGDSAADARRELARLRLEVLAVDAYDRAAVAAIAARIEQRIRELEGHLS